MSGTFDRNGQLDVHRGIIATCIGKKRSGKSVMALLLFRSYPGDRVVIDIAGDDGPIGKDVFELRGTVDDLPRRWPESMREDGKPMTLRYVPDPGSATYLEDIDTVIGMVMSHGECCILVHEMSEAAPANRTQPNMKRLLTHNRHRRVTALFCSPRPMTIDPLIIYQSDLVYVFDTPGVNDRKRVAETIGWDVRDFDDAVHSLAPHEYLRYDANESKPEQDADDMRLLSFPRLPDEVVADVKKWAAGRDEVNPWDGA